MSGARSAATRAGTHATSVHSAMCFVDTELPLPGTLTLNGFRCCTQVARQAHWWTTSRTSSAANASMSTAAMARMSVAQPLRISHVRSR